MKRNNQFIINLTSEQAEQLKALASENEQTNSKMLYIIVKNFLLKLPKKSHYIDRNGYDNFII